MTGRIDWNRLILPLFRIHLIITQIALQAMLARALVFELDFDGESQSPVAAPLAGIKIPGPGVLGLDLVVQPVVKELASIADRNEVLLGFKMRPGKAPGSDFSAQRAFGVELTERHQRAAPVNAVRFFRPGAVGAPA